MGTSSRISPADLRIEILRHWRRPRYLYHLAAAINVNPAALSSMLTGRRPMPAKIKRRVIAVLKSVGMP
jgi:hypothetical protein